MKIEQTQQLGSLTLKLSGHLTAAQAVTLDGAVRRALAGTAGSVRLDLSEVAYLDAGGIGALLRCRERAASRSKHVTLLGVHGHVLDLLHLAGLDERLTLLPSRSTSSPSLARTA